MKISDLMTHDPVACAPDTNLAAAAALMLQGDCGILPVLKDGKLCGVVTDRDLFIAAGTRDARPSALTVGDVMSGTVYSCGPDDDVDAVLALMRQHAIRRVPVEGFGQTLIGIVSMNDIVLALGSKKGLRGHEVIDTLHSICAHDQPTPRVAAAA